MIGVWIVLYLTGYVLAWGLLMDARYRWFPENVHPEFGHWEKIDTCTCAVLSLLSWIVVPIAIVDGARGLRFKRW